MVIVCVLQTFFQGSSVIAIDPSTGVQYNQTSDPCPVSAQMTLVGERQYLSCGKTQVASRDLITTKAHWMSSCRFCPTISLGVKAECVSFSWLAVPADVGTCPYPQPFQPGPYPASSQDQSTVIFSLQIPAGLAAFSIANGKQLWVTQKLSHATNSTILFAPCVSGDIVYAFEGSWYNYNGASERAVSAAHAFSLTDGTLVGSQVFQPSLSLVTQPVCVGARRAVMYTVLDVYASFKSSIFALQF